MLRLIGSVQLPPGRSGGLDHGDVDPITGRVFVAHTDFDTVDVIDPERLEVIASLDGCKQGSGVVCAGRSRLVFAAARGAGKVLFIDADRLGIVGEVAVGPKPNGLAYSRQHDALLVADVDAGDQKARLINVATCAVTGTAELPGRPRWCVYDHAGDRFLVNIRDPASLVSVGPAGAITGSWPVSSAGPHGLDLDRQRGLALVACDGGVVAVIDTATGQERAAIPVSGPPDAVWFNPRLQRLYVAIGDPGVIDVVDLDAMRVVESVTTEPDAGTTAFDQERQRLYVFMPESSSAAVYEES